LVRRLTTRQKAKKIFAAAVASERVTSSVKWLKNPSSAREIGCLRVASFHASKANPSIYQDEACLVIWKNGHMDEALVVDRGFVARTIERRIA
jgi:hypothetical protein